MALTPHCVFAVLVARAREARRAFEGRRIGIASVCVMVGLRRRSLRDFDVTVK